MKSIYSKILFSAIFVFLCISFLNASPVFAQILDLGKLHIEYGGEGALFNETNIAPGFKAVKTVTITNSGSVPHSFSIAVSGQLGSLANVLQIEPRNSETGAPIWNKTLNNIAKAPDSDLILGSIAPGQTRQIKIAAILPTEVGNDYQGTTTFAFDFVIGNESTDLKESAIPDATVISNLGRVLSRSAPPVIVENDNTTKPDKKVSYQDQGQVAGANSDNEKPACFWSWVLLLAFAIYLALFLLLTKKRRLRFGWALLIIIAILVFFMHLVLGAIYKKTILCTYFPYLLILELLLYFLTEPLIKKTKA